MREKIVCVEWEDSTFSTGYYDEKDPERFAPVLTRTVGYLLEKSKKAVLVSQDRYYRDGKLDDERYISTIPKKMIKKITYLNG